MGVEALALDDRVHHPEVRRRIGADRDPAPVEPVTGHVCVHEGPFEPSPAALPVEEQVLDEEARRDHPAADRDRALLGELAHRRVDRRVSRGSLGPTPPRGPGSSSDGTTSRSGRPSGGEVYEFSKYAWWAVVIGDHMKDLETSLRLVQPIL